MGEEPTFSPDEITHILTSVFAGPLITSTIGFILFGVNIYQLLFYFQVLARRDHLLTRAWVCVVAMLTLGATCYEVYYNWLFSIGELGLYRTDYPTSPSITAGSIFVVYSAVIMLVQMFWLSCIKKLLFAKPRLAWYIIIPIALASLSSFDCYRMISRLRYGIYGSWPTAEISILVRCSLGLYLGVDLCTLIVIISQLVILKKSSGDLKMTITKLSWILCLLTFASTIMVVGELYVELPQPGGFVGGIPITISFAPIIPTIYLGSFLAVLNARGDLFSKKRRSQRLSDDSSDRGLIPGLNFTVDLTDSESSHSTSQESSLPEPVMTFVSTRRRSGEREAT